MDGVRSEDRREGGCKLDQLRNRRLHLLTGKLALAFNCCQGTCHESLQNPSRTAIGIDVGTSAVKVIAVAEDGEVLERREVAYPLSTPKPGWSEQNPDDWWKATEEALDGLTDGVAGIGLSGQMHGLVTLDAADRPIRPAILWNDQRTGGGVRGDRGARSASTGSSSSPATAR